MKTIHCGFDTIAFAVQGAPSPSLLDRLERAKARAKETNEPVLISLGKRARDVHVKSHGQQGGYAYMISTGSLGEQISFKHSLDRTAWNGFVKLYSVTLAVLGWRKAAWQAMQILDNIGFESIKISLNRVDYCVDILNAPLVLNPDNFVAHARTTKTGHKEGIHTASRGDIYETVTVGKMPGLQVSIYDKRREVISQRKPHWFEIWNIDKDDQALTVHRVEIRAGKTELKKFDIVTWDDFKAKIGDVITTALSRVRYVQSRAHDSNITRQPLHPVWLHVQARVKTGLLQHISHIEPARVLYVMRKQKSREYMSQIIGLSSALAVCEDIDLEHVAEHVPDLIKTFMQDMGYADTSPLRKAYVRARERLHFIAP